METNAKPVFEALKNDDIMSGLINIEEIRSQHVIYTAEEVLAIIDKVKLDCANSVQIKIKKHVGCYTCAVIDKQSIMSIDTAKYLKK